MSLKNGPDLFLLLQCLPGPNGAGGMAEEKFRVLGRMLVLRDMLRVVSKKKTGIVREN